MMREARPHFAEDSDAPQGGTTAYPFVLPHEDELLYSVIARTKVRLAITESKPVLRSIFGRTTRIASPDLQSGAAQLGWLCAAMPGMTPAGLLRLHTLFPLWEAALPPERAKRAREALLVGTLGGAFAHLGAIASKVTHPSHLRLCPDCAAEERETEGEIYWHRVHQAPGVFTCPTHDTVLLDTDVPMRSHKRHDFVHASWQHLTRGRPCTAADGPVAATSRIVAHEIAHLLNANVADLRNAVIAQLRCYGAGSRKAAAASLAQLLLTRFGSAYLQQVGLAEGVESQSGWLASALYRPQRLSHPLRFILLSLALGNESRPVPLRSPTRWRCVNPAAAHYGRPTVRILEGGAPLASGGNRYTCSCGFVFSSDGTLERGRLVIRRMISWGQATADEAMRLRAQGMSVRAIAHVLELDSKSLKRLCNVRQDGYPAPGVPADPSVRRAAWRSALADAGGSVVSARRSTPALYAWLYRNDRGWLLGTNASLPKQIPAPRRRVDWGRRDVELSGQVDDLERELLHARPLVRITVSRLAVALGCRGSIGAWLPKLPRTRAVFERVCESVEQFQRRRLEFVARKLSAETFRPSRSALLRAAGLPTHRLTPELARVIEEEVHGI